jgi:hypothetical protein
MERKGGEGHLGDKERKSGEITIFKTVQCYSLEDHNNIFTAVRTSNPRPTAT